MNHIYKNHSEALEAIAARIKGVYDNQQLMKLGPLSDIDKDIEHILESVELKVDDSPPERKYELKIRVLADDDDDFEDIVDLIQNQIGKGFTLGFDRNETSRYHFEVNEYVLPE